MDEEKFYFTKSELIENWLKHFPHDKEDNDLEFNALAGYVNLQNGLYIRFSEWIQIKEGKQNEKSK